MNIRFCGFGGQGIVLSGYILGSAAIEENLNTLQTQSYGSESRGGACKSDVIISKEEIYEIEIDQLLSKVIEFFDNPDNLFKWKLELISFEHVSGEPGKEGAKSKLKYKVGKREFEIH